MRDLRASGDHLAGGSGRVDSGSILGSILGNLGPYSRPYLRNLIKRLHLAVGRASRLEYD